MRMNTWDVHGKEAQPLHAHLEHAQEPRETGHSTNLLATSHILRCFGED